MREWGRGRYKGRGLLWPVLVRNKKSITLNLREERGQEIALALAREADVVLENFRPGTLERWNLGPDRLMEENPRLVRRAGVGLRADGAVRQAGRVRLGRRGDGRPASSQRAAGRGAAAARRLARRLAGRAVRRAGDPGRAARARRRRQRARPGRRRLDPRVVLRAARGRRARVRPARAGARAVGHASQGDRSFQPVPLARRRAGSSSPPTATPSSGACAPRWTCPSWPSTSATRRTPRAARTRTSSTASSARGPPSATRPSSTPS